MWRIVGTSVVKKCCGEVVQKMKREEHYKEVLWRNQRKMVVEWRKGWGMKASGPLEWFQIHSQLDSSLLESTIDLSYIVFVSRMVNGNYSLVFV